MSRALPPLQPLMITVAEVARVLSISPSGVYQLIGSGQIQAVKFGRRALIPYASVEAFALKMIEGGSVDPDSGETA